MTRYTSEMNPIYTQNPTKDESPKAPDLIVDINENDKKIVKLPNHDEYVNAIKEKYPNVNKKTIDDIMSILVSLKRKKAKLTHKDRIQIFSKIFDCDEKEANKFYKACKKIYNFLGIDKAFAYILSAFD